MTEAPEAALASALAAGLAPWFEAAHRDLTWRRTTDPYAIWVSEIMLQQTRVETVERYYAGFLARFPSVHALADAEQSEVLEAWSGLGYYRRARLLHKGAQHVRDALGGTVPDDGASLLAVPGIGKYTAGAIASIAFDKPEPLVDGNVARVLSRVRGIEEPKQHRADLDDPRAAKEGRATPRPALRARGRQPQARVDAQATRDRPSREHVVSAAGHR